jgi:hypothetical protein
LDALCVIDVSDFVHMPKDSGQMQYANSYATLLDYDLVAMNNISHSHCEAWSPLGFFLHCKYWRMYIKRIKKIRVMENLKLVIMGFTMLAKPFPSRSHRDVAIGYRFSNCHLLKNSQSSYLTSPLTLNLDNNKFLRSLPIFNLLTLERFGYVVWHQCSCLNDGIFSCPIFFHIVNPKITQVVGYSWDVRFTTLVFDIEKILWTHDLCASI